MSQPDTFVGRKAELAALRRSLDRALAGHPSTTLVVGEAGIGKTGLVTQFVRDAQRQLALRVIRGAASDDASAPYALWTGVLRALDVGMADVDPSLPPSERRWDLLDLLAARFAATGPLLVVLEDLHWADDDSVWILEHLPHHLPPAAVLMVIATARNGQPRPAALDRVRQQSDVVELSGLDIGDLATLVDALAVEDAPDPVVLLDRTGGNPLFAREMIALGVHGDHAPAGASAVLQQSLARLDEPVKHVLYALAVAGPGTPLTVVAAAIDRTLEDVMALLEAAADAGVVEVGPGGQATFRHALFADATLADIPLSIRTSIHGQLANGWRVMDQSIAGRTRAAVHGVAALPAGDAAIVAADVVEVLRDLRQAGDDAQTVALAEAADATLTQCAASLLEQRARISAFHAEALQSLGDELEARQVYARAADLARDVADADLRAVTEVGASQHADPFTPHVERLQRLTDVEAALPKGDLPQRVTVLGRMGVLRCSMPDELERAHADGDAAVAMARRLDRPDLLVTALADRHFIPGGAPGLDARATAADELISLGRGLARPDISLQGYEWRFGDLLDRGDRSGASNALDHLTTFAHVMPSPRWRWAARLRRAVLHCVDGQFDESLRFADEVAGTRGVPDRRPSNADDRPPWEPSEQLGLELSLRATTAHLRGTPDDALASSYERAVNTFDPALAPFLHVLLGVAALAVDDRERVHTVVSRYGPEPEPLVSGLEGAWAVAALGAMAADVGAAEHRRTLLGVLAPFRRRLGGGTGFVAPVAVTLGRLAILDGDPEAAVADLRWSVAQFRTMPSPPLLAHASAHLAQALDLTGDRDGAAAAMGDARKLADRLGLRLPDVRLDSAVRDPSSAPTPDRGAVLRRGNGHWRIESPYGDATVPDSLGMAHLAQLLATPVGAEVAATELAGMDASPIPVPRDIGAALDARAKREYRTRIGELQSEIDHADADNDPERAARARVELDALLAELRRAIDVAGRDRPSGSGAERARINVTRNLRRAVAAVSDQAPTLAAHLDRSVRTGRYCSYMPEPATALAWHVQA